MAEVVFETSGSTGEPKRIVRTEASLLLDAQNIVATFPELFAQKPLVVSTVHANHMFGALWSVRVPRLANCPTVESPLFSIEELTARSRQGKPLLLITTPSFLEKAVFHPDFPLLKGSFAGIVISGSPLRAETALSVASLVGVCPLEIYGSTETGTLAFRLQSDSGEVCTLVPDVTAEVTPEACLSASAPWAMVSPFVLQDRVEFLSPRTFRLLGRADRRVKVLERFVSLTAVETALSHQMWVSAVRVEVLQEAVPRLGALVVLNEAGRAAYWKQGFAALCSSLRAALRDVVPEECVPRRFRFVRELPVNDQGKVTSSAVQAALSARCREPIVLSWAQRATDLEAHLVFPPDMECFDGHFPQLPILPGVAQLFFLRHFARQAFRDFPDVATYRKLKFRNVILPNQKVVLHMTRSAEGAFAFSLGEASHGEVVKA